jgi:subtilisin family serine protease
VNGEAGRRSCTVAQGIDYARRMERISLSLGSRDDRQVVRDAIQAAQRDGIIVVAAAGNISGDAGTLYPAAYTEFSNVVAVGASTMSGQWASFSRYGPAVDFAAPGVEIVGPLRSDLGLANPYGRAELGGTSFATPLVTGMFALMMSRRAFRRRSTSRSRGTRRRQRPRRRGQKAGAGIIIGAAGGGPRCP